MVFDDTKAYNYMTNKRVELTVVTICRDIFAELLPLVSTSYLYKLTNTEGQLGILLKEIWKRRGW